MLEALPFFVLLLVAEYLHGRERQRLTRAVVASTPAEKVAVLQPPTRKQEDPDRPPQDPLPEGL